VLVKMLQQAGWLQQQRQQQGLIGAAALEVRGVQLEEALLVHLEQQHGLLQGPLLLLLLLLAPELVQLLGRAACRCRVELLQGSRWVPATLLLLLLQQQQQMQGGLWHHHQHRLCLSP
jgi:hypothetical protein